MGIACSWSCCIDGFHRCSRPSRSSGRRPLCAGYAFIVVRLARRDLVWINVTSHPIADWVARQITEAFPWNEAQRYLRFGLALHIGKVLCGNIGGGNRLDFTCIGPAVNLAARLEKIAGRLHRTVVASAGFAGICAGGWTDLGEFPIAGFSKAERVYGL